MKEKVFKEVITKEDLEQKELLLRTLIHDLSSKFTAMRFLILKFSEKSKNGIYDLGVFERISMNMENSIEILQNVKQQSENGSSLMLARFNIEDSFQILNMRFCDSCLQKNIELKFFNEVDSAFKIFANKVSFESNILGNLIHNAVKFSPPGGMIMIRAFRENNYIFIEISDQGTGIPAEIVHQLAQSESVASTRGTAGEEGTGVGLYIVQNFMKLNGGKLFFISPASDKGSFVVLRFQAICDEKLFKKAA